MVQEQKHLSIGELFDLRGKVAAITGGASGMGFASARRLAEAGAAVLIADINPETGKKKTRELADTGYKVDFVKCDVTRESDVANMVNAAVKTFGGLDIMVNNAGIYPLKPIAEMDAETWDRIMNINMRGLFFCCLKASQQMIKQGRGGSIINITSASAFHPTAGFTAYDSSKSGVWMLTRTLALELAQYRIRVNSISPGPILTEGSSSPEAIEMNKHRLKGRLLTEGNRQGRPDEIANAVLFLASPASSFFIGSDLIADGGWTLT
jgi:NAD(P)-dependent dehydrogenase (short-subunit alcohol dehydrogenase family)